MPDTTSGLEYGIGFVLATAALHAVGIGLGLMIGRIDAARRIAQTTGVAMAATGLAMLAGYL